MVITSSNFLVQGFNVKKQFYNFLQLRSKLNSYSCHQFNCSNSKLKTNCLMIKLKIIVIIICSLNLLYNCQSTSILLEQKMNSHITTQEINYEKRGNGNNKIIFIHGFGASRKSFYDIASFFNKDYELYLIDLVGFGNSKPDSKYKFTQENQANTLFNFIVSLKLDNLIIISHSYGAGVALILTNILLQNNISVKNIILLAPATYPQKFPFFIDLSRFPILNRVFIYMVSAKYQAEYILKHLFWDKTKVTSERINRYAEFYEQDYNKFAIIETACNIIPDNVTEIQKKILEIEVPALIIWGDKDPVIPKDNILRLHKDLSKSKLIILQNVGHIVHEENPEIVYNEIITFWEDLH